ncbi:serine/threonine-protein kinase [Haliangium sp.]|uniref:serine/threonine-protein kinase n=1 Tax=Haliangium sp. TaxID=2663208 RepID=UPI003D0A3864
MIDFAPTFSSAPTPSGEDTLLGHCLVDRFRIRAVLGTGAYGRVYLAEQVALHRDVAVKILAPRLARDPEFVTQFQCEALITSRLHHPNIVSIIDFGRTDGDLVFLVMEYVRGQTLTEVIRSSWPLALHRVVSIMTQVLRGLEEVHSAGVVHADLKADNILIEPHPSGELVKVVDFGIARLLDPMVPRTPMTSGDGPTTLGSISGTPEYMAPEVIRGNKPEKPADIYAAGIVMYQLLAGTPPFTGGSYLRVLRSHIEEPVPGITPARPAPEHIALLAAAIYPALAKDPLDRYPSARAFREALEAATAEAPDADADAAPEPVSPSGSAAYSTVRSLPSPASSGVPGAATPDPGPGPAPAQAGAALDRARSPRPHRDPGAAPGPLPVSTTSPWSRREPVVATAIDFCLGGGMRHAMQVTAPRADSASALAIAAVDALGGGVRVFSARSDPAPTPRRWYPFRAILRAGLSLPIRPDLDASDGVIANLGRRARAGLNAVFGPQSPQPNALPGFTREPRDLARAWDIARAVREAVYASRTGPEQLLLVFHDVHLYDASSLSVLRVLCAGCLSPDLRVLLTAADPFDLGLSDSIVRIAWQPAG